MNRPRVLGIAQELVAVAWTALAVVTFLPGGPGPTAATILGLAAGAATFGFLALVRGDAPARRRDHRRRQAASQ